MSGYFGHQNFDPVKFGMFYPVIFPFLVIMNLVCLFVFYLIVAGFLAAGVLNDLKEAIKKVLNRAGFGARR